MKTRFLADFKHGRGNNVEYFAISLLRCMLAFSLGTTQYTVNEKSLIDLQVAWRVNQIDQSFQLTVQLQFSKNYVSSCSACSNCWTWQIQRSDLSLLHRRFNILKVSANLYSVIFFRVENKSISEEEIQMLHRSLVNKQLSWSPQTTCL